MTAPKPSKKTKSTKPLAPISEEAIRERAHELWRSRSRRSTSEEDWNEAKLQLEKEQAARLKGWRWVASLLNQPFLMLEKRVWEPGANLVERAAFFQIVERLSPVFEAIGVLLIPVVVWYATQSYQEQKDKQDQAVRQQEAIKTYLSQLTTVFLDGKIKEDKDLQSVTRASTLALLKDPSLDGNGKGQVIGFLSELKLIAIEPKKGEAKTQIVISLARADLSGADLRSADLRSADLSDVNLSSANLRGSNLSRANLSDVNLSAADLSAADLSSANLRGADLSNTNISRANISRADLRGTKLRFVKLCKTKLPPSAKVNPDRDCKELGIPTQ
ncbi:MAG: pentapeptide repeat-containing protein [Drouetiella hepatica Uher 2000/2452]|jgi:hypothetical protein|uniref:Pentapeptide repeat-containing protein n=1 Tax=Drouetiella hepatica Uher 2000/2452 TaxID=904376 RepID=A0A951UM46_9CYAN|nr:pentapeptide repeat-containing protein [Drouetiella hepatica Uher 2000/2452]